MIVASHWILAVFYVMAVTELVTESDIFFRIRLFLTNKFPRSVSYTHLTLPTN